MQDAAPAVPGWLDYVHYWLWVCLGRDYIAGDEMTDPREIRLASRFNGSGLGLIKVYHPEFGGYVYQPIAPQVDRLFIEPYVLQVEAMAYLDGVLHMTKAGKNDD